MVDEMRVTVIATGFAEKNAPAAAAPAAPAASKAAPAAPAAAPAAPAAEPAEAASSDVTGLDELLKNVFG